MQRSHPDIQQEVRQFITQFDATIPDQSKNIYYQHLNAILLERLGRQHPPSTITPDQVTIRTAINSVLDHDPTVQRYLKETNAFLTTPADQFLAGLNHSKEVETQKTLASLNMGCRFIADLGQTLENNTLRCIGTGAQSAVMMYQGYKAVTAAKALATAKGLTTGAALDPTGMVMIGMGVVMLGTLLFNKKKKVEANPALEMIVEHFQMLSQQLQTIQKTLGIVIDLERLNYEKICQATEFLAKLIKSEIRDFCVPVQSKLERLEEISLQISDYMETAVDAVILSSFDSLTARVQTTLEREARGEKMDVRSLADLQAKIIRWILPENNTHVNPILSGAELYNTHQIGDIYQNILDSKKLSFNYLMLFMVHSLGIPLQVPEVKEAEEKHQKQTREAIDPHALPNSAMVFEGGALYLGFRRSFHSLSPQFDPHNTYMNRVLQAFNQTLQCVAVLQRSPAIFEKLFSLYQEAYDELVNIAHEEIKKSE